MYVANSADGALTTLTVGKGTNTTANVNTFTDRGVITINNAGTVANPASYTGTSGSQTRCATSLSNNWYIGDQNGLYTDGSTNSSPTNNLRGVKAFGAAVYVVQPSTNTAIIQVSTVSAPSGGTFSGLPGLANTNNIVDFYLIQSGSSGTNYDVLYVLLNTSATVGTIAKYSLVSSNWRANGTYTNNFGGFGLAAGKNNSGSGAELFVSSGSGATTANSLWKLTDAAGHNETLAITTASNLKLYTAATGTIIKGVAFAPVAPTPTITGATTASAFTTTYGTASIEQSFNVSGTGLTANLLATAPNTNFEVSSDGIIYGATATFSQASGSASGSLRVRLKAAAAVLGDYNSQNIALTSTGATPVNIVTAGTGNAVTAKELIITAIDQAVPLGSALADVVGSTLFAPSGLANSETVGSVSLSFGGNGAVAGTFTGAIVPSAATGGTFTASNYAISYVNGTLTVSSAPVPTITYGMEILPALSTIYPSASSSTSFTISGVNMAEGIMATAPTGFEVSADDIIFAASVTVGASGSIGTTTVYVRLSGSTSAGSRSGSVALTSSGATTINVPLTSSTVEAKPLTGSFTAASKAYDTTTSATVTARSLTGAVEGDDVTLTGGVATFDTAGADSGKTVTLAGAALIGTAKDNYTLASVSDTTANITKATQTITFTTLPAVSNDFNLSASSSSGLSVSFASSNLGVATVSGNAVTLVGVGTSTITASQLGNENYEAADSVDQDLTVTSVPTRLVAGDIAVIGYNTSGAPADSITILILRDLNSGTVFYVNDNETTEGASAFTDLAEGEASFTVKAGQTIPSGTVITLPWGGSAASTTQYDWSTTSGFGLGNNNEEIYIYTASSITATTPTVFVYAAAIGTSPSGVPTGLTLGTTFIKPQGTAARYKISGAVYAGPADILLPAIGNITNNWEAVAPGPTTDWSFNTQYLLPVISGLSPSSVVPGGVDFSLVINGSNFYTTTQVTLAGVPKTAAYVSSGQLTIPVTAAEIASAGSLAVVVTNPTPGGGNASTSLAVNNGPSLGAVPPVDNSAFASTIQTPTAPRTFTVSGQNLITGITVTVPLGFEISSDNAVSFSSSPLLLLATGSVVTETTLHVRFNPAAVQIYSGDITVATDGVTPSASFAVLGNTSVPNAGILTGTFADGSATLSGTAPATGTVTEYIVLAKVSSPITDVPSEDGSAYSASATYGSGSQIDYSFVVYKGSTPPSAYQVTGLTNRLRYYFTMYSRVATAYSTGNSVNGFPFAVLGNVITQWDFNSQPLEDPAVATTGSFSPLTGLGTLEGAGLITTATFLTGLGSTDNAATDNSGAQTTGYPAQGNGSGTTGVAFKVSTVGKDNIVVYWDLRHSNTSSRYTQFQYSTDGGTTWNNYEATGDLTDAGLYMGNTGDTWFLQRKADLSAISAVNNNANFAFRIVTVFAPGTSAYAAAQTAYGTTGTLRYDMVTVTGVDGVFGTPLSNYLDGFELTGDDALGTADPDYDGMDNNTEFAFGTSPVSGASRAVTQESVVGGIKITWLQRSEVTYEVKSTDNLGSPFSVPVSSSRVLLQPSGLGDYEQYEATLTGGDRGFIQVEATVP
jgi:hypothetical protein